MAEDSEADNSAADSEADLLEGSWAEAVRQAVGWEARRICSERRCHLRGWSGRAFVVLLRFNWLNPMAHRD